MYNQEKPYLGLENGRRYWGVGGEQRSGIGGGGRLYKRTRYSDPGVQQSVQFNQLYSTTQVAVY